MLTIKQLKKLLEAPLIIKQQRTFDLKNIYKIISDSEKKSRQGIKNTVFTHPKY